MMRWYPFFLLKKSRMQFPASGTFAFCLPF